MADTPCEQDCDDNAVHGHNTPPEMDAANDADH